MSISPSGMVSIPDEPTAMAPFEIAELLGVTVPTVSANIKALIRLGVADGDRMRDRVFDKTGERLPSFYGLDMVVALAFRVQSHRAHLIREWVMQRLTLRSEPLPSTLLLQLPKNTIQS